MWSQANEGEILSVSNHCSNSTGQEELAVRCRKSLFPWEGREQKPHVTEGTAWRPTLSACPIEGHRVLCSELPGSLGWPA